MLLYYFMEDKYSNKWNGMGKDLSAYVQKT